MIEELLIRIDVKTNKLGFQQVTGLSQLIQPVLQLQFWLS